MAEAELFQPRRFRSAAQHYLSGRPAYAPRLIRHVARFTGLAPDASGAGPGLRARGAGWRVRSAGGRGDRHGPGAGDAAHRRGGVRRRRAHQLRPRQLVRSVAGARALSSGDDGTLVPMDGPGRDAAAAGRDDRAGRRGGAVQQRAPRRAGHRMDRGVSRAGAPLRRGRRDPCEAPLRHLDGPRGDPARLGLQRAGRDRGHRAASGDRATACAAGVVAFQHDAGAARRRGAEACRRDRGAAGAAGDRRDADRGDRDLCDYRPSAGSRSGGRFWH